MTAEDKAGIRRKYLAMEYEHGIRRADIEKWAFISGSIAALLVLAFLIWNRCLNRLVKDRTAEIQESEQQFRNLVEQSPLSIQISTPDGRISQVNLAYMKLWDISPDTLTNIYEQYNVLEDEQAKELGVMSLIERAHQGEQITLPPIQYDPVKTMKRIHFSKPEGRKRWIQCRLYPIKDSDGKILNIVQIEEDITERKKTEEDMAELRSELLHSTRAGTMVELTAALAHEINHPLRYRYVILTLQSVNSQSSTGASAIRCCYAASCDPHQLTDARQPRQSAACAGWTVISFFISSS